MAPIMQGSVWDLGSAKEKIVFLCFIFLLEGTFASTIIRQSASDEKGSFQEQTEIDQFGCAFRDINIFHKCLKFDESKSKKTTTK